MKYRQKYELTKQKFSEGLQQVVLRQQGFPTISTALSLESTKLATAGLTHINEKTGKIKYYKDNPAKVHIRNKNQMFVNGKYIPKTHPLYKAGRYKGFEDAAFSSLENYEKTNVGQVYIITNAAWEGWVKVGMAVDAEDRASSYQTSSPFRDYTLEYIVDTTDRRALESEVHKLLAEVSTQRNEWFQCSVEIAKRFIDSALGDQNEQQQDNG